MPRESIEFEAEWVTLVTDGLDCQPTEAVIRFENGSSNLSKFDFVSFHQVPESRGDKTEVCFTYIDQVVRVRVPKMNWNVKDQAPSFWQRIKDRIFR